MKPIYKEINEKRWWKSLKKDWKKLKNKELTSAEITKAYVDRINEKKKMYKLLLHH